MYYSARFYNASKKVKLPGKIEISSEVESPQNNSKVEIKT